MGASHLIKKEYLEIVKAAKVGGDISKKYFGRDLKIEGKTTPADFRTIADLEAEKSILKILKKKFPDYNIFSEETGKVNKNSEYTFIIDPLDGTNNFVLGIPFFSTSIALMKGEEIIFGVIYNSILKNTYFAEKGKGAYLNNKRIHTSKEPNVKDSSISVVVNYGFSISNFKKIILNLFETSPKRILTNWSVALDFCLLASGKIESLVLHLIPLYDFAAGKIIAEEAGAVITDFQGKELKNDKCDIFLTTGNNILHAKILKILDK